MVAQNRRRRRGRDRQFVGVPVDPDVPLIRAGSDCRPVGGFTRKNIIANGTAPTAQLVVALKARCIDKATSGRSWSRLSVGCRAPARTAMDELFSQGPSRLTPTANWSTRKFPKRIAFNVIPEIDVFHGGRYTKEEWKMMMETQEDS